jgi:hypothetical protein
MGLLVCYMYLFDGALMGKGKIVKAPNALKRTPKDSSYD